MSNNEVTAQRMDVLATGRYRLDPGRSEIAFRTRHLFGLAAVSGTMQVSSGEILIDSPGPQASVTVTISAPSFSSGNDRRDGDVRSAKFLDVEGYPEITFRAGTLDREEGRWKLTGQLTVRAVTKPVTLAIESAQADAEGLRARATTRIDRYAFGMTAAKGMAGRFLDLDLHVIAEPQ